MDDPKDPTYVPSRKWRGMTLPERFHSRYIPEPNSGCWLWTGDRSKTSHYGVMAFNGRTTKAHRISWFLHHGEIPDGVYVCHKCDVRLCVNPEHLFLGTHTENMRDMERKGRARHPKGEAGGRAKLTEQQVISIRMDSRSRREIAQQYGVTATLIRHIQTRMLWRHVP